MPVTIRITTVQTMAHRNKRTASELARIGRRQQITKSSHRLDHVDAELFANAPDENLDRVGVTIEVLVVQMLTSSVRDTTRPV